MNKLKRYLTLFSITLFILIPVLFSACSMGGDDSGKKETPTASANVVFPSKADPDGGKITEKAELYTSSFENACKYNEILAISSLCMTVAGEDKKTLSEFFTDFGFDKIEAYNGASDDYDKKDNPDSISYGLAHITDPSDNNEVIAVAIRGVSYSAEWKSNFDIGTEGDHNGFAKAAQIVYTGLKSYIDRNFPEAYANKKLKLWITGYSRSAAVSDVLSYYILTGDTNYPKLDIDETKVFTYTFATPRALTAEHAKPYQNVFNHISNADIVTYVAPEQYGLYRCGQDKILFKSDKSQYTEHKDAQTVYSNYTKYKIWYTSLVDSWLKSFSSEIDLPNFCTYNCNIYNDGRAPEADFPGNKYTTEKECIEFFMKMILDATGSDKTGAKFKTREEFVSTAQATVQYLITFYMNNSTNFSNVISKLKGDVFNLMANLSDKDSFCTYAIGLLKGCGITIDDETTLKTHLGVLYQSVNPMNTSSSLYTLVVQYVIPMMLGGNTDLPRIIKMHYPEVTLITLIKTFE
ncbi:MAG: hypothetical protein IJR80_01075 [Treponema sp.]|nr:hypothetical protein [Treponema sp.]